MKKIIATTLCVLLVTFMAACTNDQTEEPQSMGINNTTAENQKTTFDTSVTEVSSNEFMPYPETTAISIKIQKTTNWVKNYLLINKASFDSVAKELLGNGDPYWSASNSSGGFAPFTQDLPKMIQQYLETINVDFCKELGQDLSISLDTGGYIREDKRRSFNLHFETRDLTLNGILSYFPDGYAGIREDTPYVDFGDGWYFYCGDWV